VRERYLDKTDQVRKLPICLVLIVDPDHKTKVEVALAESPLRFLITQVLWQRYTGSLRPPDTGNGTSTSPKIKDLLPPGPGTIPDGSSGTPSGGAGEERENMELAIYGVVTIYDRPGRQFPGTVAPPADPKQ
jgi:hypothetical protein